jgi:hypothetical protein
LPVVLAQNTKALVTVRRRYASHASSCWLRVETNDSAAHLLQPHAFCANRPTVILAVGSIANHLWAGGCRGILFPDTARRAHVVQCRAKRDLVLVSFHPSIESEALGVVSQTDNIWPMLQHPRSYRAFCVLASPWQLPCSSKVTSPRIPRTTPLSHLGKSLLPLS